MKLSAQSISVIVPVFNEAKNIRANLDLLIAEVAPYFTELEIIVVNDGSTDGTAQVLSQYRNERVKVIPILLDKNLGKGGAVREGFKTATGEKILFIDGGMELHPKEIRIFFGLMEIYEADIVLGSKRHPQSKIEYPMLRRLLSSIFQALIRRFFELDVTDTQVGIKLFRREVIQAVLPNLQVNRYGFDLEILALAKRAGFSKMLEAPITLDYFSFNTRSGISELLHIFKVGIEVMGDTIALYHRIQKIERVER